MKEKNKRNLILIVLIVLILVLIILMTIYLTLKNMNKRDNISYYDTLTSEEKSIISGNDSSLENVVLDDDGNKINVSPNLKKVYKISDDIKIDTVYLNCKEGKSVLTGIVYNNTSHVMPSFKLEIRYLDNDKNEIYKDTVMLKAIASNSNIMLENIIQKDVSNASDVEFKIL